MFDTHLHLDADTFYGDVAGAGAKMKEAGISGAVNPAVSVDSSKKTLEINKTLPWVLPAVGIHPLYIEGGGTLKDLAELARREQFYAVGEVGLDFWHGREDEEVQRKYLFTQATLARELNLPILLHMRKSFYDTLAILKEANFEGVAICHAFSGSYEMATAALDRGYYISVGGPVTYPRKAALRETLKKLPLKALLVETDAPDLPPWESKGEVHNPWELPITVTALAETLGLTFAETAAITEENARRIFMAPQ